MAMRPKYKPKYKQKKIATDYVALGARGGEATKRNFPEDHFRRLGKLSQQKRRKNGDWIQ